MRPSPMATRAVGVWSSAALAFFRLRPLRRAVRPAAVLAGGRSSLHGGCRSRLAHSLADSVLEELRSRRLVRVSAKIGLHGTKELSDNKIDKRTLQKGLLLEFQKDAERSLLAVVERPDGKKNWIVTDQNGILSSIKPQQVTYVVPGILNFDYSRIVEFLEKAQDLLDPTVLECAWMELSENDKPITVEEFAEVKAFLRGDSPPYSASDLEGMTFIASMHVKVARRLHNNSLRYWLLEYLRRQPKGREYKSLILKFIKDRMAVLLLLEVGIQVSTVVSCGKVGDEVSIVVETAHPRDDILSVREVIQDTEE